MAEYPDKEPEFATPGPAYTKPVSGDDPDRTPRYWDMDGREVVNVSDGTEDMSAVNKRQLDASAGGGAVSSVFGRIGAVTAVSGDYTATLVTNTPSGGIAATTVQAAVNELDSEKANVANAVMDGDTAGGDLGGTFPNPDVAVVDTPVLGSGTPDGTKFLRDDRTWVTPATGTPTFATPAVVLGTSSAAGSVDEVIRKDSTIVAFDATVPVTQAFGDSAATGSAAVAARRDHKHAMPANPFTGAAAGGALDGTYPNPGIAATVAGAGLAETSDVLSVNVDGSTIEINSDALRVKADGITANEIAAGAVGASELASTAVTPATYGDASHVAQVTIDADGRVTGASDVAITGTGGGGELSYVENTSAVNVTATAEATPTTVVTAADLTVDGSTVLLVEFYSRGVVSPSPNGAFLILNLHVSTNGGSSYTDIGRIASVANGAGSGGLAQQVHAVRRITPAAGTAKYRIVGWVSANTGTPNVGSGAGGAGTGMPMFIRVTEA